LSLRNPNIAPVSMEKNKHRIWTKKEDYAIVHSKLSDGDLAKKLGRTKYSIQVRRYPLSPESKLELEKIKEENYEKEMKKRMKNRAQPKDSKGVPDEYLGDWENKVRG